MQNEFIKISKHATDITNQKFGRLTALGPVGRAKDGKILWECMCDCQNTVIAKSSNLLRNLTRSCGCYKRDTTISRNKTHGLRSLPIYHIWANIVQRCTNPNNKRYKDYGGRKVGLFPLWQYSFQDFYEYVRVLPHYAEDGFTLDRENNELGYAPGNLRFITKSEQNRNYRRNIVVTYKDETKCLMDWSRQLPIPYATLKQRIKAGWSIEKAFTQPPREVSKKRTS